MKRFKLVIFDLDGTLLDTLPDVLACANIALEKMQLPQLNAEQIKKAIGPGSDVFARVTMGVGNEHRLGEFFSIFRPQYEEKRLEKTGPFEGIRNVLDQLSDLNLAVATNKPLVSTKPMIKGLGMDHYFDLIAGPELVTKTKPDPEMIHYTLNYFGLPAESAILIGDTNNDILAAQAINVKTCAVGWGYSSKHDLLSLGPDYYIEDPSDLLRLFY